MLSTVDSVLMAAMFTFMRDIHPTLRGEDLDWLATGKQAYDALWLARIFGAVLLLLGISSYIFIDMKGRAGNAFIGALFAFYTAQLSMLPLVLGTLFLHSRPSGMLVLPGLVTSAVVSVSLGLYATFANQELQWWPVPVCLIVGFGCYGISVLVHRIIARTNRFD